MSEVVVGRIYQDSLDSTRTLVPTSLVGRSARCRVFFNGAFGGIVDIPMSLFGVPYGVEPMTPPGPVQERRQRRWGKR